MKAKKITAWIVHTFTIFTIFTFSIAFSQEFTPDANTVGLWHFNEGTGLITSDASGNGNNGQLSGTSWTTQGKFGNALSFDGNSDKVQRNSPFSGIQNIFTIELYFKSDNFLSGRYLFSQRGDYRDIVVAMPNSSTLNFSIRGTDGAAHEIKSHSGQ